MPDNKNFAYRIEIIDECLRNRFRKWTLQDLIDAVNDKLMDRYGKSTGKRTIQDDIKYLKEEKEAPIEKRKEGAITFFYYTDQHYSLKNLPINEEEVNYLNDAIHILRQVNDFKILNDVDAIVTKLENTINTNIENAPTIIQFEKHTTALGIEYIDDIFSAIKSKLVLRISYQTFTASEPTQYPFHPYLLKEFRNRWFLIGRIDAKENITNFALDRIKGIKVSNNKYVPNDLFDPETYFNNLIGVTMPQGESIQEIDIRVTCRQAPYIRTKPIHHTQEIIKDYVNGDIKIRLWLINNFELRSVLQSFGSEIEVLKPTSLRENLKTTYEKALKSYQQDAKRLHPEL
jgi:predicted DNA-binding transcriptional regulator YafY